MIKNYKLLIASILFFFPVLLLNSCNTTSMTAEWKNPAYNKGALKSIVVMVMFDELSKRQAFENGIVEEMNKNYNIFSYPSLSFLNPNKVYEQAELEEIFAKKNIDGILILNYTGTDVVRKVDPDTNTTEKVEKYDRRTQKYYTTYKNIVKPGKVTETQNIKFSSNLYENDTDELIWRADTESTNPPTNNWMIGDIASVLCGRLAELGLMKTKIK